jgi:isoamylase
VRSGRPLPLGAHVHADGVNFALFSRHAEGVWLELYATPEDTHPRVIELEPSHHRTGDVWHVWVQGISSGQLYTCRVDGPYDPDRGHRFNRNRALLDPYATAITHHGRWDFEQAIGYDPTADADVANTRDDADAMPKCVVTSDEFDWEGDQPLRLPWSDMVIYETHVRGLTVHPSSEVDHPGTYRGLTEKIPYLKDLGVTAIELMPVHEFNSDELDRTNPETGERLRNYWGYNTVGFLAPKASYSASGRQVREFKEMVKAFHEAGIEIILDVVFNHTAEGNEQGPTFAFRGIDNAIYYMLTPDKQYYENYSGTGNTINANHPVVRDFILDALRYWTLEMHVDGFRFDLASVLDRDEDGNLLPDAPLLERIAEDPILREVRVIAEAWDAAGAYQVGSFSEARWAEWNGRYRDDVRRFWRGDDGMIGPLADRICGSSDVYQHSGKGPESSINLVTCHDGFTLNDLVSYTRKHNEANGEDNRDGSNQNNSANYGVEGPSEDLDVETLRVRQIKNHLATLFVSRGVPMLLGGDEFRRTQNGNNNAYCQDNETSWYDWTLLDRHQEIHRFARAMISFRRSHPTLRREAFYKNSEIRFSSPTGDGPNWSDTREKRLGVLIHADDEPGLFFMYNAWQDPVTFALPTPPGGRRWHLAMDTSRPSPDDVHTTGAEPPLGDQQHYDLDARTCVILVGR